MDFDDREWKTLNLPLGESHLLQPHWLRRKVELPQGTDHSQLTLTLGTIQTVYEVYVNGRRAGASSNWNSYEDAQIPRPRTFFLPAEVTAGRPHIQIALRIKYAFFMVPIWILPDTGPYVLSYSFNAPLEA
ncbi:MAG: hypothetical protein HY820_04825, partial [Acidobacteria bacterium]|nr:hypothetical protein [Acidobacteriota bacterium]